MNDCIGKLVNLKGTIEKTPLLLVGMQEKLYDVSVNVRCTSMMMVDIHNLFMLDNKLEYSSLFKRFQETLIQFYSDNMNKLLLTIGNQGNMDQIMSDGVRCLKKILKTQEKRFIGKQNDVTTVSTMVMEESYYLTNIDLWILATQFKLPIIVLNNTFKFKEHQILNPQVFKNNKTLKDLLLLLHYEPGITHYILVRQQDQVKLKSPLSYSIIYNPITKTSLFNRESIAKHIISEAENNYIPLDLWLKQVCTSAS